jgi:hypothetical protein
MPARSGRSSGRERGLTRVIRSVREAVRGLRRRSAGGLRGPSHVGQPVTMAIGGVRAELGGVEARMQDVAPPGTHSNDTATTAAPPGASRRIAVFGSGNADGVLGRRAGGP